MKFGQVVALMRRSNCSATIPPPGTPGDITFFVSAPPFFITFDFCAPPLPRPPKEVLNLYHNSNMFNFFTLNIFKCNFMNKTGRVEL